jgi:hypothetical protein
MRQPRVFISCSRADQALAAKLADYLRRAYDEVWFDEHRYGGEVWWDEILWNIRACDLFIYLVSPESVRAAYCQAEYAEAVRLRKQILPVVIRPMTVIPSVLRPLHPLDMTRGVNPGTVGAALSALKHLENRLLPIPQPPISAEPTPMPLVEDEPPRPARRRWLLLPMLGVLLLLLWTIPRLGAPSAVASPTATATGTRFVPTATLALPAVTVILMTPTQPSTWQATRTPVPATQMASSTPITPATASRAPSSTSTATLGPATATPSVTPTLPTSTSTVPPTVTRRVTATSAAGE